MEKARELSSTWGFKKICIKILVCLLVLGENPVSWKSLFGYLMWKYYALSSNQKEGLKCNRNEIVSPFLLKDFEMRKHGKTWNLQGLWYSLSHYWITLDPNSYVMYSKTVLKTKTFHVFISSKFICLFLLNLPT